MGDDPITRICGEGNPFFNKRYLSFSSAEMKSFLEQEKFQKKEFIKRIVNACLCMESIKKLRKINSEERKLDGIGSINSNLVWYSNMLLLIIGLIDQATKKEKGPDKKPLSMKKRFIKVMGLLDDKEKKELLSRYLSSEKRFNNFNDLASHIYNNRNIYAHDLADFDFDNYPQHGDLAVITDKKKGSLLTISMGQASVLLYVMKAYLLFLGFKDRIAHEQEEPNSIADFL